MKTVEEIEKQFIASLYREQCQIQQLLVKLRNGPGKSRVTYLNINQTKQQKGDFRWKSAGTRKITPKSFSINRKIKSTEGKTSCVNIIDNYALHEEALSLTVCQIEKSLFTSDMTERHLQNY